MIEKILRFSIYNPFIVFLFTLILSGYGAYSFIRLPIDAVPDITSNQIQINTLLPGFSPQQTEKMITYVIENALGGIPGLIETRSISRNAFSQVTAIFTDDTNIYFARQQINERLNEIKEDLPLGAEPKMGPISTGLGEVYMWSVEYKHPKGAGAEIKNGASGWQADGTYKTPDGETLASDFELSSYLRTVQDWIIKPQLKNITGLAGVDSIGGFVEQYEVEPDFDKLIALNLSFQDIIDGLEKNNISRGPGYFERNGEAFLIRADQRINSFDQIKNTAVRTKKGISVKINEIADVKFGKEMRTGSATKNGEETVIGTAMMLIGANSRTVSQEVDARLLEINKSLPDDIIATPLLNRTKLVNATISTVFKNLAEGAFLVIAVLFLFLKQFRASLITALVIPLSMLMAAIGMVKSGISGNLMSLGAIDFGLIVDGAVIIAENCLRRIQGKQEELGKTLSKSERLEEIFEASKEMVRPSVFGQAIILIVYIPLLTLTGVEGKMFHPMAATVIFALIAAFCLSITFVPAMLGVLMQGHIRKGKNRVMGFIKSIYKKLLQKALKEPEVSIISGLSLFAISLGIFWNLGQEFVPTLDEQDIAMHAIRIPSTSLTQSTHMQKEVEKTISGLPEVAYVFSKTGTAEMASDPMPPCVSDTFIILHPRNEWPNAYLPKNDLIAKIEKAVQAHPGNNYEFTQPIQMRFNELISGVKSDFAVKIYGDDVEVMQEAANEIGNLLDTIQGSEDVKVSQSEGLPLLDIKLIPEYSNRLGIHASDVLDVLSIAAGGGKAGQIFKGDRRFDILVRAKESNRNDLHSFKNLPIPIMDDHGDMVSSVPLKEIAELEFVEGLNEVQRENGKRFVTVEANIRNRDLGSFVHESLNAIQEKIQLPQGTWIQFGGQFVNFISAKEKLKLVLPILIGFILVLLYMALHSFRDALMVFSGVPLALTGGIFALWLRDMPFSISSAVGLIALSGIAVLNGLVLISSIEALYKKTNNLEESIIQGAALRLRPVLMTAFVASLGFLPMALAATTGAEVQKPIATVVIGGLISSTLLTLFILPSLYKRFAKH